MNRQPSRGLFDMNWINRILPPVAWLMLAVGLVLRFYNITQSDFIFYDEGLYLNHNRAIGELLAAHYPANLQDFGRAFYAYLAHSLASGKGLWFILSDLRLFAGGLEAWYVPRLLSACFGLATFFVTYRFARRYYHATSTGWLAAALLMILPSHVFYSRTGLQEACSTFLVIAGFYFYCFPRKLTWRTFVSGLLMAAAFFANYRLMVLPVLVAVTELWEALSSRERPSGRKYLWFLLTFLSGVFLVGNIHHGQNTIIIFSWMFHQADMAQEQFAWLNFLSYPYYLFRLEHVLFGTLFFANLYFVFRRRWQDLLPFVLVCVQMAGFSLASDKAARYVCVVTPFMVMAAAHVGMRLLEARDSASWRKGVAAVFLVMMLGMGWKSAALAQSVSAYRASAAFVMEHDPQEKFLSTQNEVQNLYTRSPDQVVPAPYSFQTLVALYAKGYRYLVICPQAYVSWTADRQQFSPPLTGVLGFLIRAVEPVKIYDHFDDAVLERFVFEHSSNLERSVVFLRRARRLGYGKLRVYDLSSAIPQVLQALAQPRK